MKLITKMLLFNNIYLFYFVIHVIIILNSFNIFNDVNVYIEKSMKKN